MARRERGAEAPDDPATDPHALWAEARAKCPVHADRQGALVGVQVASHAAVLDVLRDGDVFSSGINQQTMGPYMGPLLLAKDGAEHTRHRNLVSHAFRASALVRWEEELIRPVLAQLLDAIAPCGRADLIAELTSRYPVQVILGILGVPAGDHEQFLTWAEDVAMGPANPQRGRASSEAMRAYFEPLVEARRESPRDDLISDIVTAELDGERLDDEHVYGFRRLLMPAGAETTYRLMGTLLLALLSRPEALARVRADRALVPRAVEETLRWETSISMVHRVTTRGTTLGGVDLPAGASVLCLTSSANRDTTRYPDADAWDLDRDPSGHLAFGWGRHQCLGMHLARLELRLGLEAILDRLPGLRLDPEREPPRVQGVAFRGPARLDVRFDAS
jgi:cytochrome P450